MRQLTRASLVIGLFAWLAGACGARTGDESLDDGFGGSDVGGTGFGGTGTGAAGHPGGGGIVSGGTAGFGAGGAGFGGVAAGGFGGVAAGGFGGIPTGGVGGFGAGGGGFGGVAAGGFGGVGAFGGVGGGPSGPCCFPHPSPGCFDPKITACVCQTDQFCCQQQWDSLCANEVTSLGCGNCGGTGGAGGFGGFGGGGFGGGGFGGVGNFGGGGSGGSGGSGGAVICGGNFCSDVSAPGGLTLSACCPPTSPFSCGLDTTSLPPFVPLPNGCLPKNQQGVPDPSCPNDNIAGFPLAGCCKPNGLCGNDYSVIQLGCVDTSASGGPPPTKCGVGGGGGTGGGGPFTGSCCESHPWQGCDDPGVLSCVCPQDPFCCNGTWDSICVGEVTSLGCGSCGGVGGGGGAGGGPACNPNFCPVPLPGGQPCCVTSNGPCGVLTPQGCIPFGFPPPPNP